tara:strand:- start:354 stop:869 length:516 start_codon:yes stop_codon:yes gene_type:complete
VVNLDLCLVRHGSTDWTEQSRFCGWTDVGLSGMGKLEAESLKKDIDPNLFDMVFSSDLSRCLETAEIIGSDPKVDSRLREVSFGKFEGLTWEELDYAEREIFLDLENFRFPEGESQSDFVNRVRDFLFSLETGRYLLFTHGGVIRLILSLYATESPVPPGGFVKVSFEVTK